MMFLSFRETHNQGVQKGFGLTFGLLFGSCEPILYIGMTLPSYDENTQSRRPQGFEFLNSLYSPVFKKVSPIQSSLVLGVGSIALS